MRIAVQSSRGPYDVVVEAGVLANGAAALGAAAGDRIFLVSAVAVRERCGEPLAASLRAAGAELHEITVADGEEAKSFAALDELLGALHRHGARRRDLLVALGGGTVGDSAGLAAALYQRGMPWAPVPTTLLAMADAAVGGKVAVNFRGVKNLAGAFHPPRVVLADPLVLATLPERQLRSGAVEVLKAGILGDAALFADQAALGLAGYRDAASAARLISAAVAVKARIAGADEREGGERRLLNLGHTLGHALEAAGGFEALTHGEAVAWGIEAAVWLAGHRGLLAPAAAQRIREGLAALGPFPGLSAIDDNAVLEALAHDKKRSSERLTFVLPVAIGEARIVEDVTLAEATAALAHLRKGEGRCPPLAAE